MGWLRLFLRGTHKHAGSVVEVTSVAIAGGDLGRGFVCVQRGGVKIQSSKMQIARK